MELDAKNANLQIMGLKLYTKKLLLKWNFKMQTAFDWTMT